MPRLNQNKTFPTLNQQPLADFKVGVDNAIFSVDIAQNRLLVLLIMRPSEPFAQTWGFQVL